MTSDGNIISAAEKFRESDQLSTNFGLVVEGHAKDGHQTTTWCYNLHFTAPDSNAIELGNELVEFESSHRLTVYNATSGMWDGISLFCRQLGLEFKNLTLIKSNFGSRVVLCKVEFSNPHYHKPGPERP